MNEMAISIIRDYQIQFLFEPKRNWDEYYFAERCYSRWAADEIIERLIRQETLLILSKDYSYKELKTPVEIIVGFIVEMEHFSDKSDRKDFNFIFSSAKETAEEILYLFL